MNLTLPKNIMKRGHSYAVRYTVPSDLRKAPGKREVIRGLGTRDLAEAVAKRDAVLVEIKASLFAEAGPAVQMRQKVVPKYVRVSAKGKGKTIAETAEQWLSGADGIATATRVRYKQHLDMFERYAGNVEVTKINRAMALGFMDYLKSRPSERTGQPLSQRTLGSYQVCLSSYWRVLEHWGLVDQDMKNPFSSLLRRLAGQKKVIDPRKKNLRPIKREEAEALLRYIVATDRLKYQREMFVTVRLLWATACRLNEIAALAVADIEDHSDYMSLKITKAKTEAGNRTVMVIGKDDCDLLRATVRRAKVTKPVTPDNAGMLFPRLLRGGYDRKPAHYLGKAFESARRNLPNGKEWDMHSFRRAGVSALVNAGVARGERNLAVGHSNNDDIGMSVYAKHGDLSEIIRATFEAMHEELGGSLTCQFTNEPN